MSSNRQAVSVRRASFTAEISAVMMGRPQTMALAVSAGRKGLFDRHLSLLGQQTSQRAALGRISVQGDDRHWKLDKHE